MITKSARTTYALTLTTLLLVGPLRAQVPRSAPEEVGMRSDRLALIDELVAEGLEKKRMPGCVVLVGRKNRIVYHKAFGHRQLEPKKISMSKDCLFDMASITKPVATATSVMILVEQGKLRLRDRVATYIPEFANSGKEEVTLTQLLTHQAGLIPDNSINDYKLGRETAFKNIYALKTRYAPGSRFVYSDVGFILLDDLIERASGKTVAEFAAKNIFAPLGMQETSYLPSSDLQKRAATTEQRESRWMQGEVHDPRSYLIGGVAGHAGLFSTAGDLAIYAQMMLNGGHYRGHRILAERTVNLMTSPTRIAEGEKVSIRGLGWDKLSGYSSNRGENMSSRAFGHGGFTGTVLWIDPELDLFFVFLSNRVHPNGKGSVNRLAGRIASVAVSAIDDELLPDSTLSTSTSSQSKRGPHVETGIDVLVKSQFDVLQDQRVGLITNQTGIDSNGHSTIDLMLANNVNLDVLFSPEHGLYGKLDQATIGDAVRDGLKVYSLYGKTRSPLQAHLSNIDTVVFDIQDIGCRFYTYISTMGLAMKAANMAGKRFVVLDRPNPINGRHVSGPMLDPGSESFVGFHHLPVRHGMTVGELAEMFKTELSLEELDLQVVPCSGWKRGQYFDATGLPWINPSPNMRNLNEAILYPGIGLWETTNISVGRGTDTPFERLGAPWISGRELAHMLNTSKLDGVRFTPVTFTPTSSKFANEECQGIQISITDRSELRSLELGITLACSLWKLYPNDWEVDKSGRLLCSQKTLEQIKSGKSPEQILAEMQTDLAPFLSRRSKFLKY